MCSIPCHGGCILMGVESKNACALKAKLHVRVPGHEGSCPRTSRTRRWCRTDCTCRSAARAQISNVYARQEIALSNIVAPMALASA